MKKTMIFTTKAKKISALFASNCNIMRIRCILSVVMLIYLVILFHEAAFAYDKISGESDISHILNNSSLTGRILQMFFAIGIIGIAPSILIMCTSFVRIVIILSITRNAIGLQQSPPNQIIISLALFLTFFIMSPYMETAYEKGLKPLIDEQITEEEAFPLIAEPFKKFMLANTRSKDLNLFASVAKIEISQNQALIPLKIILPSFMISELRRAFEIGFLVFLPFLIIDIVTSSILMAMGMMMMPPVMIALPFKIIFFVLVDGWYLLSGGLIQSFVYAN